MWISQLDHCFNLQNFSPGAGYMVVVRPVYTTARDLVLRICDASVVVFRHKERTDLLTSTTRRAAGLL
jgi:hypothetical protein